MSVSYWEVAVPFFRGDVAGVRRALRGRPVSFVDDRNDRISGEFEYTLPKLLESMLQDVKWASKPLEHQHLRNVLRPLLEVAPDPLRWGDCLRTMIDAYASRIDLRAAHSANPAMPYGTPRSLVLLCAKNGNADLLAAATEKPFGLHDPNETKQLMDRQWVTADAALVVLRHPNLRVTHEHADHKLEQATCEAIANGDRAVVERLHAMGVDLTKRLLRAEHSNQIYGAGRQLISQEKVRDWVLPFHMVRDVDMARALLTLGADPHAKEAGVGGGGAGLMDALTRGLSDLQRWYVEEQGVDLEHRDDDGCTPLLRACRDGGFKEVKYLLSRGADQFAKTTAGETALMCSLRGMGSGAPKKLRVFMDAGMALDDVDANGQNVGRRVRSAAERAFVIDAVQTAMRSGKPLNQWFIQELLADLVHLHDAPSIYRIVESGALDVKAVPQGQSNVLHLMAQHTMKGDLIGFDERHAGRCREAVIAEKLVAAGLPIDIRNERGYTPLMEAVSHKQLEYARALIALGADFEAKTPTGRKVVTLSRSGDMQRMLRAEELSRSIESVLQPEDGPSDDGAEVSSPQDYTMKGVL